MKHKLVIFAIIANLFTACVTTTVGPQGFKTSANLTMVDWSPTHFSASTINSSTPDGAIWRGANKLAATVATAGIAIAVPGSGTIPAVTRATGIVVPHLGNPSPTNP